MRIYELQLFFLGIYLRHIGEIIEISEGRSVDLEIV
jgi:hypothetical protein